MGDQLGDHRVIVRADGAAGLDAGVHPNAVGQHEMLQFADRRQEARRRVLGI